MLDDIERARLVLSADTETIINVENLLGDQEITDVELT